MPRHKKKQPSDNNSSTTSLTRAQRTKVLKEKRRAAVSLAQEKHTNPASATPPSVVAQPIVVNEDNNVTSPLSTGISPRLPPFDHARLRERVSPRCSPRLPPSDHARLRELLQYKSYADQDNDDCDDKNDDDNYADNDVDDDGVPLARVVDKDDDGGGKCPAQNSTRVQAGEGLYYRNDDYQLDEVFDNDYDDKYFSSIPGEEGVARSCNRVLGGPQLNPNATSAELIRYRAERKKFTNKNCRQIFASLQASHAKFSPHNQRGSLLRIPGISLPISV
jgi:hypothetical protein